VSQQKFAPITSSLLARKGGAMPSLMHTTMFSIAEQQRTMKEEFARRTPEHPGHDAETHPAHDLHHDDPAKPKKLFVAMSHAEFERLAIASVKTGLSRHEIVRDALDFYFEQIARDLRQPCACVAGHSSCAGTCGA
jgi:hypothetical protein